MLYLFGGGFGERTKKTLKKMKIINQIFFILLITIATAQFNNNSTETGSEFPISPDVMTVIDYLLTGAAILLGLVYVFFGYKIFKAIFFISGVLIFFATTYILLENHLPWDQDWKIFLIIGISAVVSILGGCLFLCIINIGFFAMGAVLGLTIGTLTLVTPLGGIIGQQGLYVFLYLAGFSIIFGIIAIFLKRPFTIVGTAFGGSYMIAVAIDAKFIKDSQFSNMLPSILKNFTIPKIQDGNFVPYILLGSVVVLGVLGTIVQFKKTGKDDKKKDKELYQRV